MPPRKFGECTRIPMCSKSIDSDTAITVDGSDYYSAVLCAMDFGCVLHEVKELYEFPA